jgi:hypothetical protein
MRTRTIKTTAEKRLVFSGSGIEGIVGIGGGGISIIHLSNFLEVLESLVLRHF